MKRPLSPALVLAALLAGRADAAGGGVEELPPALGDTPVGEPLPDLRLPTIDGGTRSLSSFRGRPLLLVEFVSW